MRLLTYTEWQKFVSGSATSIAVWCATLAATAILAGVVLHRWAHWNAISLVAVVPIVLGQLAYYGVACVIAARRAHEIQTRS